ncbi:uncharacterized protein LOC114537984 [Dendronephthya gigantea]|uniref:uncharacterized protein LOC114537984 n=1 Tax=Dendronephthya gigantea TaxID=151771 RepID=UPI00106C5D37|nr:uncharacterized protein LOC114537984 [Dendronephthya gigantea]
MTCQDDGERPENDEKCAENLKYHAAKFLLRAKKRGNITQTPLDTVKISTKDLLNEYFDIVKASLIRKLRDEVGEQFQFSQDMEKLFDADSVFEGLNTEYQQQSFFKSQFNLVEPRKEKLGVQWKHVTCGGRKILKRITAYDYLVPLLQNLEALLNNPDVMNEVDNPHSSDDGIMRDIMDGEFFRNHPIFSRNNKALQLLSYYNDLELANPLGSKAKIHKIGVFYYPNPNPWEYTTIISVLDKNNSVA